MTRPMREHRGVSPATTMIRDGGGGGGGVGFVGSDSPIPWSARSHHRDRSSRSSREQGWSCCFAGKTMALRQASCRAPSRTCLVPGAERSRRWTKTPTPNVLLASEGRYGLAVVRPGRPRNPHRPRWRMRCSLRARPAAPRDVRACRLGCECRRSSQPASGLHWSSY